MLPRNELGYRLTVLVGRERVTGMAMVTVLPSTCKFAADRSAGYCQTDQETAIKFLVKVLVSERADEKFCRTIVEEPPVESKGSNGVVGGREDDRVPDQGQEAALEDRIGRRSVRRRPSSRS